MPSLDSRKICILQAIVNDYVLTTKPVGSERLIELTRLNCKSATLRNEMADMSEMGYLLQPHTSAGRIPSDRGYRFYVDELMDQATALTPEEVKQAEISAAQQREVEEILQQTCRILTQLTSYPSLATDPSTDVTTLRRIYLSQASPRHALLVALLSTGHVEHRLLEFGAVPSESVLLQLSNYVNSLATDRLLEEIGRAPRLQDIPSELAAHRGVIKTLFDVLAQIAESLADHRIFVEGTNQFLRQPEFQDVQRLEGLLRALEQRNALYQALHRALRTANTTIVIGAENDWEPMQECSVITTSYRIGTRTAGYLAVVGPTRMHYPRAAAAVSLMAQNLSAVLTNLSLA